ncbi:MAG: winged helix-turn-helix transcriptional regulator [Chitinophagales bacterium]|nr:winged helix-turn-helix transcriptional regulator [Chitinophagales bacterium]
MKNNTNIKPIEETLLPWIGRTTRLYSRRIQDSFKENDLDFSREQIILLKHLTEQDGLVQNDLACASNRDKTSLTRLVSKMEAKGLVTRMQCAEDNRCNKIYITPKGREKFEKAFPIVVATAKHMQEALSEEEIASTIKVLKKIINHLSENQNETK